VSKWKSAMDAYEKFVVHLEGNKDLKENSYLTAITFNDKSIVVFNRTTPDKTLKSKIIFTGGNTDFSSPLLWANAYCKVD
jgi:hypothetical protein